MNKAGNAIDDHTKIEFARTQSILRTFPVFNVRLQGIPADDTSLNVPPGESANMEPAVYAIGTTDAVFRLVWLPAFERASPRGQHSRKIIRMNNVGGSPTFQFVKRHAKIIQALLIDEFEFAFRRHGINKAGNAIDDQAKTLFARANSFLSTLPVFNVSGNTVPANHATTVVQQRLSDGTKPAIDVIEPTHTLVYNARFTSFDRMQPCCFRSLDILGMEHVSPSKAHQVLLAFAGVVHDAPI